MRVTRTDLQTGETKLVAGYERVNLQTGRAFMEAFASKEANERNDIDNVALSQTKPHTVQGGHEIVQHRATLIGKGHHPSLVEYRLECPIPVTYVSEWDGSVTAESEANYYAYCKEVTDIQPADNGDDPEVTESNCRTDEYIRFQDGTELREEDGVTFDY